VAGVLGAGLGVGAEVDSDVGAGVEALGVTVLEAPRLSFL
jgi:hypothetical protein